MIRDPLGIKNPSWISSSVVRCGRPKLQVRCLEFEATSGRLTGGTHSIPAKDFFTESINVRQVFAVSERWKPIVAYHCVNFLLSLLRYLGIKCHREIERIDRRYCLGGRGERINSCYPTKSQETYCICTTYIVWTRLKLKVVIT